MFGGFSRHFFRHVSISKNAYQFIIYNCGTASSSGAVLHKVKTLQRTGTLRCAADGAARDFNFHILATQEGADFGLEDGEEDGGIGICFRGIHHNFYRFNDGKSTKIF